MLVSKIQKCQMDVAIMRLFEICLKFGHSWLCLKHTGVRAYMCVYVYVWTNV